MVVPTWGNTVEQLIRPPRRRPRPTGARLFRPGWPLAWLFYGFPLFWALGVPSFAVMIMAVPMAIQLSRRLPLRLPPGFGFWLLFLLWSLAGVLLLAVNPPGTVAEPASSRLLGFAMREASYIAVTIVLLYVGNLRESELSSRRIAHMLGWFFVVAVAGGVAGLLVPNFEFTSPFEMLLPSSIANNLYVQQLTHPTTAQVQDIAGTDTPRPAAPFGYTNTWGFHMSVLGVWFVARWVIGARIQRQLLALPILAVGVIVLIYSLNRSAWIGVLLAVTISVLLLARRGKFLPMIATLLAAVLATMVLAVSPLGTLVESRLNEGKSNDIRAFTTEKALELSLDSPIVGYGSTRNALGSHSSIAVGKSPECPQCGNVSIGINGYIYMLLMTTGWVGMILFFLMWLTLIWRSRGDPSPWVAAGTIALCLTIFYAFTYDVSTWMLVPMVSAGMLWRADQRRQGIRE